MAGLIVTLLLAAQATLAFDVASVKPNVSGGRQSSMQFNLPDGFTATNFNLKALVSLAYSMPGFRISGGPSWFTTDTFDVVAKAGRRINIDEKREMLRTLLGSRFGLRAHVETREGRVFALTVAAADGHLGPAIHRSTTDCAAIYAARAQGQGPPIISSGPAPQPVCGAMGGLRLFRANGVPLRNFALTLGAMMEEIVIDRTGLTDPFDFELRASSGFPGAPASADDGPSVFTALQEQLGLKLVPERGPIETLVIDAAERPTPD